MVLQAFIRNCTIIEKHAEYSIEIKDNSTGEAWEFCRRYSVLRKWHDFSSLALKSLPIFPKKKLFGNLNPLFLEKRRKELEVYINSIIFLYEHPVIKSFIKPNDRKNLSPSYIENESKKSGHHDKSKNTLQKIATKTMENMIDLSDLASTSSEKNPISKTVYEKMIFPLSDKNIPTGSNENIESLYKSVHENGHWVRKKFRHAKKVYQSHISEKIIENNLFN
ncbi:hypothetical protein SteCoe_13712 [Stentor coeruleus]|uniref:PX domain-containing protein n=1 Tax=Stentor coeruleus TaxID=5963 RepID=A0A1R2C7S4_9CILI|nr:hypothetical protein SteCoe_13712 [Stentor coeruleus]